MFEWLLNREPRWVCDIHAHIRVAEQRIKEAVMAVGTETQAALDELGALVASEADQRAEELVELLGADADTAAAIRGKFAAVKAIVPDKAAPPVDGGEGDTEPPA